MQQRKRSKNTANDSFKRLALRQLDKAVRTSNYPLPRGGWLARVRKALGLSQAALAKRMGVSQQSVDRAEKREATGAVTLETLQAAARAMDCKLVYFLVPAHDQTFEELLKRRARAAAERLVRQVDRHMLLEDQQVSAEDFEEEICDMADEIFRSFSSELWDDWSGTNKVSSRRTA